MSYPDCDFSQLYRKAELVEEALTLVRILSIIAPFLSAASLFRAIDVCSEVLGAWAHICKHRFDCCFT
jgi:hypothetical protein